MQALGQLITNILNLLNLGVPTDNIVTIALLLFVLMLGLFAINFLGRRSAAVDQQRVAALIKGLHFAGIAHDVLATARTNARDHLLRGLRWLLASAGLSCALFGSAMLQSSPDGPRPCAERWSASSLPQLASRICCSPGSARAAKPAMPIRTASRRPRDAE